MQGGDDDVDALLAQFALEEKAKSTVDVREDVVGPSARVYASFTAHPTSVSCCDLDVLAELQLERTHACYGRRPQVYFITGRHLLIWRGVF